MSGWDIYRNEIGDSFSVAALVLDGTVNFGNSGGALCNSDGRVVGVVCAQRGQPLFVPSTVATWPDEHRQAINLLAQHLNTGTGLGFALHPVYIRLMLEALGELPPRIREPYYPNVQFSTLPRRDFVAFQVAAVEARRSPIGPFSYTQRGEYFVGWHNDPGPAIPASVAWQALAPKISQTGGSFFLLGSDVRLYRRRQDGHGGYDTVPLRLALAQ